MFKVIVERPRRGGSWAKSARPFWSSEDAPVKMGIKRGHRNRKWLNEHLGPLRKFLARRVGRLWDAVYSEICAVIDNRSTVKQHVLSHIPDFVAIKTRLLDGKVYGPTWSSPLTPLRDLPQALYVDPVSGVLRRNEERVTSGQRHRAQQKRYQEEIDKRRRVIGPAEQLHRIDGVWYFVKLAMLPEGRREMRPVQGGHREAILYEKRWDALCRADVCLKNRYVGEDLYGRRGFYAIAKRQLNARELRKFGLK